MDVHEFLDIQMEMQDKNAADMEKATDK